MSAQECWVWTLAIVATSAILWRLIRAVEFVKRGY